MWSAVGDTALTPPIDPFTCVNDGADLAVVTLDRHAVAEYAAHAGGVNAEQVEITGLSPISVTLARYWNATVAHIRDNVLGNPVVAASPILVDDAFRVLAAALLSTFPNTVLAAAGGPDGPGVRGDVPPARLREVLDYLHINAHRPIGPADLAAVTGRPAREVVESLRRHRDTSPAHQLWQARLLGVRRELRDTDPMSTTVAAVAARWGFDHVGRFRIAYTKAFDEQPEDTLQR